MPEHQGERLRGIAERLSSAGLRLQENTVSKAILTGFADQGKAPSVEDLAHALGLPLASVRAACRTLAVADLIIWQDDITRIVSAYPFSGVPTAHHVLLAGHTTRYAMQTVPRLTLLVNPPCDPLSADLCSVICYKNNLCSIK